VGRQVVHLAVEGINDKLYVNGRHSFNGL
jgi:hypothetical protein